MTTKKPGIMSLPPGDEHVGACGLFCTNCKKFIDAKCEGCQLSPNFAGCPVRKCCEDQYLAGCWECPDHASSGSFDECRTVNGLLAKAASLFTGKNRPAALAAIKKQGMTEFVKTKKRTGKM